MGNCFSSCFPKEDPETIALREENERAADPGRMKALRKRLAKIMKYHLLVDGTVTEPVPSKSRRRREHTDTDYQEI